MDGEKSVVQDEKVLKAKSGYAMLFTWYHRGCCLVWL